MTDPDHSVDRVSNDDTDYLPSRGSLTRSTTNGQLNLDAYPCARHHANSPAQGHPAA